MFKNMKKTGLLPLLLLCALLAAAGCDWPEYRTGSGGQRQYVMKHDKLPSADPGEIEWRRVHLGRVVSAALPKGARNQVIFSRGDVAEMEKLGLFGFYFASEARFVTLEIGLIDLDPDWLAGLERPGAVSEQEIRAAFNDALNSPEAEAFVNEMLAEYQYGWLNRTDHFQGESEKMRADPEKYRPTLEWGPLEGGAHPVLELIFSIKLPSGASSLDYLSFTATPKGIILLHVQASLIFRPETVPPVLNFARHLTLGLKI